MKFFQYSTSECFDQLTWSLDSNVAGHRKTNTAWCNYRAYFIHTGLSSTVIATEFQRLSNNERKWISHRTLALLCSKKRCNLGWYERDYSIIISKISFTSEEGLLVFVMNFERCGKNQSHRRKQQVLPQTDQVMEIRLRYTSKPLHPEV